MDLSPVAVAAVLNLVGAFLSVTHARTISDGIVDEAQITPAIIFGGLVGAIVWNLVMSTTHVVSGGVIGAGVGRRLAEVRWGTAGRMVLAWLFTLPAAAAVGALSGRVAQTGTAGTVIVALVAAAVGAAVYLVSRRNPVGAHNVNDSHRVVIV
jgi:inorganic phosphate transporter, PiT family